MECAKVLASTAWLAETSGCPLCSVQHPQGDFSHMTSSLILRIPGPPCGTGGNGGSEKSSSTPKVTQPNRFLTLNEQISSELNLKASI